jgi:hypothetical protein
MLDSTFKLIQPVVVVKIPYIPLPMGGRVL